MARASSVASFRSSRDFGPTHADKAFLSEVQHSIIHVPTLDSTDELVEPEFGQSEENKIKAEITSRVG